MTTEDVPIQPTGEERWRKLLRRAFEIPDIVSTDHSEDAVTFAMVGPASPSPEVDPQKRADNARIAVQTIVKMGGNGELDELFVPLSVAPKTKADIADKIDRHLENDSTKAFVVMLLDRVTAYAEDHPWDEPSG